MILWRSKQDKTLSISYKKKIPSNKSKSNNMVGMSQWKGKVAIVTGASVGIGAAIAEKLVGEGLIVVALARRTELVEELAKKLEGKPGKLHAFKGDITNEEDVLETFKWISNNLGTVSVVVNNAGILYDTTLTDGNTEYWRKTFDTNVIGLCMVTREAIKGMRANNINGHIIHINSVQVHHVPGFPKFNVFMASKHAVTALTETLRQELNHLESKIKVSSISPGMVHTTTNENLHKGEADDTKKMPGLEPKDIADGVLYILSTPPHVQIHQLTIKPVGEKF